MNTTESVAADTISLLNRLIVAEKNGEQALRAAAEEAWHAELKQCLLDYSRFFGDAARDLQDSVVELGAVPQARASFDNALHRTWVHLRALAYGRDERVVLDDVERDESQAEALLGEALTLPLPADLRALLARQYEWARRHHDSVHALRERLHTRH